MSNDNIFSFKNKKNIIEEEKQQAFDQSIDNMVNNVKNGNAGPALVIHYADDGDLDSMMFASNTSDVRTLYWMLNKAAQHLMDFGYGDPESET
jgi:hypothetical protein